MFECFDPVEVAGVTAQKGEVIPKPEWFGGFGAGLCPTTSDTRLLGTSTVTLTVVGQLSIK